MRRTIIAAMLVCALVGAQAEDAKIIPVTSWPSTIVTGGKLITGASVADCVKAGYRLLEAKPVTPIGKRITSQTIVQDPKDVTKCKYQITYEDAPAVKPPPPETITNVSAARVVFRFSTNGGYRGITWLDCPTNGGAK